MELLRSIMVPESRSGLTRRIVLGVPDQPAPLTSSTATPERSTEAALIPPAPRRTRPQGNASSAMMAAAGLVSPLPAPVPEVARPASATPGSIGFRINFARNSDVVPSSAFPFIDRIADLLRAEAQVKLQVEGHTDALGSDAYNLDLSQRRAAAVANYLVDRQGIEATRLVVLGMGEGAPLVENGYDPRNRRVQFARVD